MNQVRDDAQVQSTRSRSLLREPLLHFLLLGAIVFAVDAALASREEDPNLIVIDHAVDDELIGIFQESRGREPDAAELEVLRQRWLDNELLYREGLALRLDKGDTAIRERVIFKALNVLQANLELPAVGEDELRAWFDERRDAYDEPPRVDFLEAVIEGRPDAATVQAFAAALNEGAQSQIRSGLRVFRGRPRPSVVASFGEDFAAALDTLPVGRWHVLDSREGPRAILIEARSGRVPVAFEDVRAEVLQDWRDRRMQELRTAAVRELAKDYVVRVESDRAVRLAEATP